ncbi:MAG: universal stress protein [Syntrophaceae bacterium]|nr:universal stress protein [Syntrophaceae bacterium]
MKLLEKIVFATDFGKDAEDVLQMAGTVAKTFNSELVLMHVVPEIKDSPLTLDMVKEAAKSRLEKFQNKLIEQGVHAGQILIDFGSPFDKIIQLADQLNVNVIMVGSGAKTDIDRFQLGITAEKIVQKANKPVWVVKKGGAKPIERILCPVDFSEPSKRALTNAIHLTRNFQAELVVLTVIQTASSLYPNDLIYGLNSYPQETFRKRQQTEFDTFLRDFNFHNIKWDKVIVEGTPYQEILDIAQKTASDLLIMGSTGKTGLARILMGSVAEKVIREMPCSVLTVKSEHVIRLKLQTEIADIETHFKQGKDLLKKGFPEEALSQFQHCISKDMMFAPAWEGLAAAQEQLGRKDKAKESAEMAKQIRQTLWQQKVEAEIRGRHELFKKK